LITGSQALPGWGELLGETGTAETEKPLDATSPSVESLANLPG